MNIDALRMINEFDDMDRRLAAMQSRAETVERELAELREALDFHQRAAKLMLKRKKFIVVAEDEPYFIAVYNRIREHEISKRTWTNDDEKTYQKALKGGER